MTLAKLRELYNRSTPVVSWYAHPYENQVRGPYDRWLQILGPKEVHYSNGRIVRADYTKDIEYAAAALTYLPKLLHIVDTLKDTISSHDCALEKAAQFPTSNVCNKCITIMDIETILESI